MNFIPWLLVLGVFLLFGLILYFLIASSRKHKERKSQIARTLGFSPIEPDMALTALISKLYSHENFSREYELHNVSQKITVNGKMLLFDLVDTSGEDDSYRADQALAVFSDHLDLPRFVVFPKADIDGVAANLANKVLQWVLSKFGTPLDFSHVPEFERRYVVVSPDPDDTRRFLDDIRLNGLAQARMLNLYAGGSAFALSQFDPAPKSTDLETMKGRLRLAMDIHALFQ